MPRNLPFEIMPRLELCYSTLHRRDYTVLGTRYRVQCETRKYDCIYRLLLPIALHLLSAASYIVEELLEVMKSMSDSMISPAALCSLV